MDAKECCEQHWTNPDGNTPRSTSCTATYFPPRKLSKFDEPDMQGTAGKQGQAYKWCSNMDPLTWPSKSRATCSNLHSTALWGYGYSPEDMLEAMNDREKWRERVRDIHASGMTWWWWWWWYLKRRLDYHPQDWRTIEIDTKKINE